MTFTLSTKNMIIKSQLNRTETTLYLPSVKEWHKWAISQHGPLFTFVLTVYTFKFRKTKISADIVRKHLKDLSLKIHTTIQPVLVSRNIEQEQEQSHQL